MPESNRRRHPRVKLNHVSTRLAATGALHIGLAVENISLGGCFVRCATPLKIGAEVHLELQRPGASSTINVLGRVVSVATPAPGRSSGMGIAFFPMPREVSQRIEGLVGAVSPSAVRTTADLSERRPDSRPVTGSRPALVPPEVAELRARVAALTLELAKKDALDAELKKKHAHIAELEATVERLKQRLLLYEGRT
jgi:Tfp pilus assembly protein PilZ